MLILYMSLTYDNESWTTISPYRGLTNKDEEYFYIWQVYGITRRLVKVNSKLVNIRFNHKRTDSLLSYTVFGC